jgi:beta-glucanase (GH16 family)
MRNARLGLREIALTLALSLSFASASEPTAPLRATPGGRPLVLTFSDDFNSLNLWNGTSGTWDTKYHWLGPSGGSINDEQEWYVNSNYAPTSSVKPWTVDNGVLSLTAAPAGPSIQPHIKNYKYTSGLVTTQHSFSQTYGYFEIRATLPAGKGLWPAFWLLPADLSWPPEIDILEVLGKDPTKLYTTVHYGTNNASNGIDTTVPDMSAGFHTYAVDWEPDTITWYFDGRQVFKAPTPPDMHKPMYMLANLGVGGSWPGAPDASTHFPASYMIDYIRAYRFAS